MDIGELAGVIGTGVGVVIAIYTIIRNLKEDINKRFENVDERFQKIESDISHIKESLIEIKTILRMKECCMIQDERKLPKAE